MAREERDPQTFVEMVLVLLEDRFPWLGSRQQEQVSGADTVDTLSELHQRLCRQRAQVRRMKRPRNT
jgi:hypothetical protein